MRRVFAIVPKTWSPRASAPVFAQPDAEHVNAQVNEVVRMLGKSHPKVARTLDAARADVRAFAGFPVKHWRQICRQMRPASRDAALTPAAPNPHPRFAPPSPSAGKGAHGRLARRSAGPISARC